MGWFDGASDLGGHKSSHHHHGSSKHHSSGSIFGSGSPKHNSSRSSFFGFSNNRSSSYYKRSPRSGYLKRAYAQLRRLLRDLIYYLKRHPMKVFMLVIMPLITGGALTGLLARFGIRLPGGWRRCLAVLMEGFERSRVEGPMGAFGGLGNLAAGMGGVGGAMNIAKMFM
ncbi:hypothetical protein D0Z07_2849 [Hyphodiscus hymeniophilus]|uniref:Uncharacterized protein n=1 Tax=Hyphodiscus hymeniophilus TaxID=353542 RepID=A0A9P6VNK5_9HELO|nr:hypothetical protein D0Z07_2849 [Hyphodiscus hymeniophilus]